MIRAVLVKILITVTVLFNLNIVFADERPAFFVQLGHTATVTLVA